MKKYIRLKKTNQTDIEIAQEAVQYWYDQNVNFDFVKFGPKKGCQIDH